MKYIVVSEFYDKYIPGRVYAPGDKLDWDDQARIDDCVERGLIRLCDQEKTDPEGYMPEPDLNWGHLDPEDLSRMKIDDLRKLAADMGINTAHLKKKTELIDAIVSMEVAAGSQDPETE